MAKILVEDSALESIKKMAQELQEERDELLENLKVLVKAVSQESGVTGASDNLFSAWNKASAVVEKLGNAHKQKAQLEFLAIKQEPISNRAAAWFGQQPMRWQI